jgi:hypothetical protein
MIAKKTPQPHIQLPPSRIFWGCLPPKKRLTHFTPPKPTPTRTQQKPDPHDIARTLVSLFESRINTEEFDQEEIKKAYRDALDLKKQQEQRAKEDEDSERDDEVIFYDIPEEQKEGDNVTPKTKPTKIKEK